VQSICPATPIDDNETDSARWILSKKMMEQNSHTHSIVNAEDMGIRLIVTKYSLLPLLNPF